MFRYPVIIPAALYFFSLVTIAITLVQAGQILTGTLPAQNARLATVPLSHFTHAVAGGLFGLIGPIQFGRVLAQRYGRLHRVLGRIFVIAGAGLALSSLALLFRFPTDNSALVSIGRLVFGIGLGLALIVAMISIRKRDFKSHRNWMIRAYALGIGATAVSMIFIPIYAVTGTPPTGLVTDVLFIGSWALCVGFAEWLLRRL